MDVAEATGAFGLLSGVLSVLLPYFLGLVVALSILGAGIGILRMQGPALWDLPGRWGVLASWAALAIGWTFFLSSTGLVGSARGLVLGASAVPLWMFTRRPQPFGGSG